MILVTGSLWMKEGYRSIGVVCHELASEAKNDALMTLYTPGWAIETAEDMIKTLLDRKITLSIILNSWENQPALFKDVLMQYKVKFPSKLRIFDFKANEGYSLHAKTLVIDKTKAVIGSSNLSWSGMHNNYEIAVLLEGKDAEKIAHLLQTLLRSPLCCEIQNLSKK